jgi:hypothetical protein
LSLERRKAEMNPETKHLLDSLSESKLIKDPDKNLRSKIDSIVRSLENLSEKKLRIEFEIKKQQKSLIRKRQELKLRSKSNRAKLKVSLESQQISEDNCPQEIKDLLRLDSILLQESDRVLDLE